MGIQYHIKAKEGDIAPYVILPGDPKRVPLIAEKWDESSKIADNREYVTYSGVYRGAPISCTSTGIGSASTSIAIEELSKIGAKVFLRVGTCGGYQDGIQIGDVAIFDSAARFEGTSRAYAPIEFPAVAHYQVIQACIQAAENLNIPYHVGTTRSADFFYAKHKKPGSSFNSFWQSNWENFNEDLKRLNIIAAEMESSVIFTLSRIWGLRAGGICLVTDNVFALEDESGDFNPEETFDVSKKNMDQVIQMGCEVIRIIYEEDQKKYVV